MLIGSIVGATVGLLMTPVSGPEIRRRIAGEVKGVREKAKSAMGNVESKARELAQEVTGEVDGVKGSIARRRKVTSAES
jgi:gas vesicle protein